MELFVACKEAPLSESIEFAKANNIGIEVKSFSSPLIFQTDWHGLLDMINKQLENFTGSKTLHGIFKSGHYNWNRMTIQEHKKNFEKCLEICEELDAKLLVVHSTYIPGLTSWKYKDWLDYQVDLWAHIAKLAQKNNIVLALENIVDESPKSILDVIEGVDEPNMKVCIDFGHLNLIPSELTNLQWIEALEKHLCYLHVHNNNGRYDSHSALDDGTIDYKLIFNKILELKSTPKVAIEANSINSINLSLSALKEYLKDSLPIT